MEEEKKISPAGFEYTYTGFENHVSAQHLKDGETCKIIGIGNSMTPILKSRQPVIVVPVTEETELKKNDIVLCKVNGHYYLHKIWSVGGNQYLIGNNHNHSNGKITRKNIFGKVLEIIYE